MLAKKIRKKRKEMGYSQEFVSNHIGITPSAYGKIERGETKIDIDRLKKISEILEIHIFELFKDDDLIINNENFLYSDVIPKPIYMDGTEAWKNLIEHLKEEIVLLRKEKDQLLRLVEKLSVH